MNQLHSIYEKQLIGRIIGDPDIYYENADIIHSSLFNECADIFETFSEVIKKQKHPGLQRILAELPSRKNFLADLMVNIDFSIPVEEMVQELEEARMVSYLDNSLADAAAKKTSEEKLATLTHAMASIYQKSSSSWEYAFDLAKETIHHLDNQKKQGIKTGFRAFDTLTGGLQPSDLVIIAAESSQGKTSLALNITESVVEKGFSLAFISLEMSKLQLMLRLMCSRSEIPKSTIQKNLPLIHQAGSWFEDKELLIADVTNSSLTNITGLIRSACIRNNIDVAVIDYLQLITDKNFNGREQEVGAIARALKNLAKELDITIIALSQLSRPKFGNDHTPSLSRLRDSGQIEEAADIVWFIYRPEVYGFEEYDNEPTGGMAVHLILKGRNYGTAKFKTDFFSNITKFRDRGNRVGNEDAEVSAIGQSPF